MILLVVVGPVVFVVCLGSLVVVGSSVGGVVVGLVVVVDGLYGVSELFFISFEESVVVVRQAGIVVEGDVELISEHDW